MDPHAKYCGEAESTATLQNCVKDHHAEAQARLNSVYEDLSKNLDDSDQDHVRAIQKRWIEYRDAECTWEAGRAQEEPLQKIAQLSCEARMTEDRADLMSASLLKEESPLQKSELSGFPRWMNALSKDNPNIFWRFGQRLRGDLNCDESEDIAISGIKVMNGTTYVLAIVNNQAAGRPSYDVFEFEAGAEDCKPGKSSLALSNPYHEGSCHRDLEFNPDGCATHIIRAGQDGFHLVTENDQAKTE